MNCFLFFFKYPESVMVFRASTEQGPCEWNGCLYRALCGPLSSACPCVVSRGLVQSWGDTTAGHCVLGRRRELPVQRITCLSPFPCHVLSAEGHIGPEPPPPHDDSGGVRPHPHSSPSGCRGHASLGGGRNSLAPVTSALG